MLKFLNDIKMLNLIKKYGVTDLKSQFLWKRFMSTVEQKPKSLFIEIAKPESVPVEYWKKVLWVALDLKKAVYENDKHCLNFLKNKHVTILFARQHGRFLLAFTLACDLLGARRTVYYDPYFHNQTSIADSSKLLSRLTDMFVTYGLHHDALVSLSEHATVPVFSASCSIHCLQKGLADMMTFYEKLNKLKGLTLAWVGSPSSIFNTYLFLCTKFGMDVRYVCICLYGSGRMSPAHKVLDSSNIGTVKEFKTAEEAVANSNIIATAMHPERVNNINLKLLQRAHKDWYFMHTLPRTSLEVSDDVFFHKNNLSWEASENYLFIAMSVLLMSLKDYTPKIPFPDFDGIQQNQRKN